MRAFSSAVHVLLTLAAHLLDGRSPFRGRLSGKECQLSTLRRVVLGLAVTLVIAGAYGIGRITAPPATGFDPDPSTTPQPARSWPPIPAADVPGSDVAGLQRFPGSVRVEFRSEAQGELRVTEVEYLVLADLEEVRIHYRNVFDAGGWVVGDLQYRFGEWTFFIIDTPREATVEVEARSPIVEIEITVTEPLDSTSAPPATPRPTPPPTAPPPPIDDDDDDGGDDDARGD